MAVVLLTNNVGFTSDSWSASSGAAADTPVNDMITGPRSSIWKSLSALTTHSLTHESPAHPGAGDMPATHIVMARADLMARNLITGGVIRLFYWNGAASVNRFGPNTIAAGDLIGVRSQDYVTSFTRTVSTQWELRQTWGSGTRSALSKVYLSDAFEFNKDPLIDLQLDVLIAPDIIRPMRGTRPYEVEANFSLTWRHITLAKLDAFRALPGIYHHPIFIYDDAMAVLPWKLEHAIITDWTQTLEHKDLWSITINFARLKHYD